MESIFRLALIIIPYSVGAQISGIGPFQINTATYKIVDSIASSAKLTVKEAYNTKAVSYASMQSNKTSHIISLIPDPATDEKNSTDNTYRQPG